MALGTEDGNFPECLVCSLRGRRPSRRERVLSLAMDCCRSIASKINQWVAEEEHQ